MTTREVWRVALEVSAYSLVGADPRRPALHARRVAACSRLTYYGAEKVVPNYNVMGVAKAALECATRYLADDLGQDGIRVNAISAGPIKTLAAAGIKGMRDHAGRERRARPRCGATSTRRTWPGPRSTSAPTWRRNVTGEVLHVDAGQNIMGVIDLSS